MVLVVYSHLCGFCLGDWGMAGNRVLILMRLPCFFFISGWLFERVERCWTTETVRATLRHKFRVQIIPTFVFLLLLAPPPEFFLRLGAMKGGYWFTFVLFEFFALTIFAQRYLRQVDALFAIVISVLAFLYDVYYNSYFSHTGWLRNAMGLLSFGPWRYYVFFYFGILVRRNFSDFLRLPERPVALPVVTLSFAFVAMVPHTERVWLSYVLFLTAGLLGVVMTFGLFRRLSPVVERLPWLSFVGTRTLDIYLIHFFFLPRWLSAYAAPLYASKPLAVAVILLLSVAIVALCLLVSHLLRKSSLLAYYLFGAKTKY